MNTAPNGGTSVSPGAIPTVRGFVRRGVQFSPPTPSGTNVARLLGPTTSYADFTAEQGVPTYTYDITKMGLEQIQVLMVEGSDDTAGARLRAATNEEGTAVAQFMSMTVSDKGAFFMGRDPALFRVRGEAQAKDTMIASGCDY